MSGSNISETFPRIFDQAIALNDALTPMVFVFVCLALIGRGMQCMNGDVRGMIGGITLIAIVSILIPTFPEIINSIQLEFHKLAQSAGANPSNSAQEFAEFIIGESEKEDIGFVDVLLDDNGGAGKAFTYLVISIASFLSLVTQYIYAIAQQFLFVFAVALSPIFFSFLLLKDTRGIAVNYFLGTLAIAMWPIGFAVSDIGTSSLLELAANSNVKSELIPEFALQTARTTQSIFFAAIISFWMFVSTVYTPKLITKVITTGANAGGLLLHRVSSAITLGTAYSIIARGTSQLAGASPARSAAATTAAGVGGVLSGATDTSPTLLPAVVGVVAANSKLGEKGKASGPTDYNAKASEIAERNKS